MVSCVTARAPKLYDMTTPKASGIANRAWAWRTALASLLLAACSSPQRASAEGPSLAEQRVTLEQATTLVRAEIFERQPGMNPQVQAPLLELSTDELWERLSAQLFQVTEGVREGSTYLLFDGSVEPLGESFGGHGVMSCCVTDLDADGSPELVYSYSWGSGIHRSQLAVARIVAGRFLVEEPHLAFGGDLFVRKVSNTRVVVESGGYEGRFGAWTREAVLGTLVVEPCGSELVPRVELQPLEAHNAQLLWTPGR